jgi:hypothetical protein
MEASHSKERYGRCRICQKFTRLTREHVPPKKAFNDRAYLEYYVDKINEAERLHWETRNVNRDGVFLFTLCKKCNGRTGTLYGTEFVNFIRSFTSVAKEENANSNVEAQINNFYPLRIVKQVISMMLSTSRPRSFENDICAWNPLLDTLPASPPENAFSSEPDQSRLRNLYEELRSFVENKNARGLPSSVRLYAHAVANKGAIFHTGIFATGRRSTNQMGWLVLVGGWPIHWTLVIDGDTTEELLDVTDWANFEFKYRRKARIQIPVQWSVGKYPLDFRSPWELNSDNFMGSMRLQGFIPEPGITKEQLFQAAMSFARRRGKWTKEGYLMTEFKLGTYVEAEGVRGWFEGVNKDQLRRYLKSYFAKTRKGRPKKAT